MSQTPPIQSARWRRFRCLRKCLSGAGREHMEKPTERFTASASKRLLCGCESHFPDLESFTCCLACQKSWLDCMASQLSGERPSALERHSAMSGLIRLVQARIIHERFCCNRRSAATTSLRSAGSPFGPSTYCTSTPQVLRAPRAALATRLSDFATNRHE